MGIFFNCLTSTMLSSDSLCLWRHHGTITQFWAGKFCMSTSILKMWEEDLPCNLTYWDVCADALTEIPNYLLWFFMISRSIPDVWTWVITLIVAFDCRHDLIFFRGVCSFLICVLELLWCSRILAWIWINNDSVNCKTIS